MNRRRIEAGLIGTASTKKRVQAFQEAGLPSSVISAVAGVKESTLRNWASGAAEPRPEAASRLDDLRLSLGQLVSQGLRPDEASNWMQSRLDEPPHARPIDILLEDPGALFDIINSRE